MTLIELMLRFPIGCLIRPAPLSTDGDRDWLVKLFGDTWQVVKYGAPRLIVTPVSNREHGNWYMEPSEWVLYDPD